MKNIHSKDHMYLLKSCASHALIDTDLGCLIENHIYFFNHISS